MWKIRLGFWNVLLRFKFRHTKPVDIPVPTDGRWIVPVPFAQRYPDIGVAGLFVADRSPKDETKRLVRGFCAFQAWLYRVFPPAQGGLPPVDGDPRAALSTAYPAADRKLCPPPLRPLEYDAGEDGGVDLGLVAVASPYACYLTAAPASKYQWDLRALDGFDLHPGCLPLGVVVEFDVDPERRRLVACRIDCALGSSVPESTNWDEAKRLAMCAVSTHLTLVRHFNWLHLVCGAPAGIAIRNYLPEDHVVRRLLQPHFFLTQFGNEIVTKVLMEPAGDFANIFSFTHSGMRDLFAATLDEFDLRMVHPSEDAEARGLEGAPFEMPAFDNRCELMELIRRHVRRFMERAYGTDDALRRDLSFVQWLDGLTAVVPHGVPELAGRPVTVAGTIELLATLIYLTTVEHEIVDSNVWHYQLWNDVQPARMYESGALVPVDVYQRLVNFNFILSVPRTRLIEDFKDIALEPQDQELFALFVDDLTAAQEHYASDSDALWRIAPAMLRANMNY